MKHPKEIIHNNHYVPCMYLKRFESRPGWIYRYDLLVPHTKYPTWQEKPIDRVGSANRLYTTVEDGFETDTHERWLNTEYETPAEDAIDRAVTGKPLTKEHWRRLVRFVAAQDVRTPARLAELLASANQETPAALETTLKDALAEFQAAKRESRAPRKAERETEAGFPARVLIRPSNKEGTAEIRVETVVGRKYWLWSQRHLLGGVAERLHEHQWTILTAPDGITWSATDNPVIRLNFTDRSRYDFGGGWGRPGTDILMPLDPKHLLHTQIGKKRSIRGTELELRIAALLSRIICEHAFRHIFSPKEDPIIPMLKRRHVSLDDFRSEKSQWANFAKEQMDSELNLNRPLPGG